MSTTINRLHKELGKLIDRGHGRKKVLINKKTFTHTLEGDGCVILDVEDFDIEMINFFNDDGGLLHNNGQEKYQTCLVLYGENR